jgi:hypothetical protein
VVAAQVSASAMAIKVDRFIDWPAICIVPNATLRMIS